MTAAPLLPGQTLRIGVTGTRKLDEAQLYFVRPAVEKLLRSVIDLATKSGGKLPRLQVLSPLAEGADRLVAECAMAQGFELVCPLPFPQAVYEEDFTSSTGSVADFRRLLARAEGNVLALDGARDDPKQGIYAEARSYEAVGRLVVRNCDLIIGIWNGLPGEGLGGTADTIRYAANFGPPVVWIHATDGRAEPRWIEEAHDLRHGAPVRLVGDHLNIYLKRLLEQPKTLDHGDDDAWLHKLGRGLDIIEDTVRHRIKRPRPDNPLARFAAERPKRAWPLWELHGAFMGYMAGGTGTPGEKRSPPKDPWARVWFDHYRPATGFSSGYAKRYRSSYVLAFILAAFALSAAAFSLAFANNTTAKIIFTGLEFVMLALIAALVITDGRVGWHSRAIDYRLIAELCRKQQALAPLAWVVPRSSAWADTAPELKPIPKHARNGPVIEPISWVAWRFSAWLRDSPLPSGTIDVNWVENAKTAALHDLLDEQIKYHDDRRTLSYRAGKRLEHLGESLFLLVVILVFVKLGLLFFVDSIDEITHYILVSLGLLGAILPAASAAFVGIRAYAELEMLAEQSAVMLKALTHARKQIEELNSAAPLASQALGSALAGVALLMLEDLEGWARLFRGKILDV
jgi:hypothetical protein